MRICLQRVSEASVTIAGERTASIGRGLLLLVGIAQDDDGSQLQPMAEKIAQMRIFPDERGRFHHSLIDIGGAVLLVPQFTLFADTTKGRRPDFFGAMKPPRAAELFTEFAAVWAALGISPVATGVFGAEMQVGLVNDGPVTIWLES
ncbi:MAG: D-tyrosyl-tRNA(Tyr) deacylase [Bdellovibrionales bacterium]|nr:D-tyrosyl-tRNA(Tyr) deacylase [Bdellovibrionales bacterium]